DLRYKGASRPRTEYSAWGSSGGAGCVAGGNGRGGHMAGRARLERELRESEARFRFLIENSPDIIFSIDPSGRFTYISDTVRRSLGFEPDQLIGSHFVDLIVYDSHEVPGERFA